MPMSAEARKRISDAQKRRWAAVRAAGGGGGARRGRPKGSGRRGRPPGSGAGAGANPYMNMSVGELIRAKEQMDEAWQLASRMLRG